MAGTSTPHLQLYKADPNDNVNVLQDLDSNWDKVDTAFKNNYPIPRPYLHAVISTTHNVVNGAWTAINMDLEVVDTINGYVQSGASWRYVPTVPGWYKCFGQFSVAGNAAGDRVARFRKNGLEDNNKGRYGAQPAMNGTGLASGQAQAMATFDMNGTTDFIQLYGLHNAGVDLQTEVGGGGSFMIVEYVGKL